MDLRFLNCSNLIRALFEEKRIKMSGKYTGKSTHDYVFECFCKKNNNGNYSCVKCKDEGEVRTSASGNDYFQCDGCKRRGPLPGAKQPAKRARSEDDSTTSRTSNNSTDVYIGGASVEKKLDTLIGLFQASIKTQNALFEKLVEKSERDQVYNEIINE
jgi:hypothetical protein